MTDDATRPTGWRAHWPLVRTVGIVAAVIAVLVPVAMTLRPADATVATDSTSTIAATSDSVVATSTTTAASTTTATTSTVPTSVADDGKSSAERRLVSEFVISNDDLQPKSIVASGTGIFVAQNMMYRHNVMVFDRSGNELAKIDDTVDLAAFGVPERALDQLVHDGLAVTRLAKAYPQQPPEADYAAIVRRAYAGELSGIETP